MTSQKGVSVADRIALLQKNITQGASAPLSPEIAGMLKNSGESSAWSYLPKVNGTPTDVNTPSNGAQKPNIPAKPPRRIIQKETDKSTTEGTEANARNRRHSIIYEDPQFLHNLEEKYGSGLDEPYYSTVDLGLSLDNKHHRFSFHNVLDQNIEGSQPTKEFLYRKQLITGIKLYLGEYKLSDFAGNNKPKWHSMDEVRKQVDFENLSAKDVQLLETLFEIITTQGSFVNNLRLLAIYFMNELEKNIPHVLAKKQYDALFSHVAPLIDNEFLLFGKLTKEWEDDVFMTNIGNTVKEHFKNHGRLYKHYGEKLMPAIEVYYVLMEQSNFRCLIEPINKKAYPMSIDNYLKLPATRILKLELLLKTAMKNYKSDWVVNGLETALDIVGKTAKELDFIVGNAESLADLLTKIDIPYDIYKLPFVDKNRTLQNRCKGTLANGQKVEIFLFSDIFMVTEEVKNQKRKVSDHCKKSAVELKRLDSHLTVEIRFVSAAKGKSSLVFTFDSIEDWKVWEKEFRLQRSEKSSNSQATGNHSNDTDNEEQPWSNLPAVRASNILSTLSKEQIAYQEKLYRIVLTHQDHVKNINFARDVITKAVSKVISTSDYQTIFQYVEPLWERESALLQEMENMRNVDFMFNGLCPLINKHYASNLESYALYAASYKKAIKQDLSLLKANSEYKRILSAVLKNSDAKGTALDYYLLLPMKRVRALMSLLGFLQQNPKSKGVEKCKALEEISKLLLE